MSCRLDALCFDASGPLRLARFWAGLLGAEIAQDPRQGIALVPGDEFGLQIRLLPTEAKKVGPNQLHFHLTSTSLQGQQETVEKALWLGARHIDVGQRVGEGHVVLADPEGNEFCVIEPTNAFLADCGFFGEVTCEGSQRVGYFWSEALGWPLVWDQNEETSIRSSHGGPKISWGGPPVTPKTGKSRFHFDLAPVDGDQQDEVDRLAALGAVRVDTGHGDVSWVVMVDPDGNEFCVLSPH